MPDILDRRLKISPDAVDSAVGDETVLLLLSDGNYYGLDAIGTAIWEALKAGAEPRAICEGLAADYRVDRKKIEADVRSLLLDLEARGIIASD